MNYILNIFDIVNITNKKHIKLQVNVYAGVHFIYDLICFIYR